MKALIPFNAPQEARPPKYCLLYKASRTLAIPHVLIDRTLDLPRSFASRSSARAPAPNVLTAIFFILRDSCMLCREHFLEVNLRACNLDSPLSVSKNGAALEHPAAIANWRESYCRFLELVMGSEGASLSEPSNLRSLLEFFEFTTSRVDRSLEFMDPRLRILRRLERRL